MLNIDIPAVEEMEMIRVFYPNKIPLKKNGKIVKNRYTHLTDRTILDSRKGIYFIISQNMRRIIHIGTTCDLRNRIQSHICLLKEYDCREIYFLEEDCPKKRIMYENIYKYYYFKSLRSPSFYFYKEQWKKYNSVNHIYGEN